ncbi:LOW QUALITY PROTEIN: cytochrome P450 6a2-like, partial [Aphomia sociella]
MFLLSFLIIIILAIYFYVTRNYQYWSKRNVKHDPPIPFFGNHYRNFFGYSSITSITIKLCNKYYNEKVIGYYRWTDPELIVNDPDIIKRILNKDFEYFHVRGVGRNPDVEPLFSINLFHSDGDIWKLLRKRLTPAFTSAKLKGMFPLIVKYTEKLQVVSEDIASRGGECDVRELVARFFTEFIGACGFGIEMNAINNEISHYREFGKLMFRRTLKDALRFTLWELFPILRSKLYVFDRKIEETMMHIIKNV